MEAHHNASAVSELSAPLEARDLVRFYRKAKRPAVGGVDLTVSAGEIVTLLGPNGAGKTTTVKMCSGLLTPTSGTVRVNGVDPYGRSRNASADIGLVLGGDGGFYNRATVEANMMYFADLAAVPSPQRKDRTGEVLDAVGLRDRAGSKVRELSRGMRQRLHIARGMLARPRLLLFDEPTNGLDPENALVVRRLVRELTREGVGVLLTTHYLAEAEALSDRLVVLREGNVRAQGHLTDLSRASGLELVTTFSLPPSSTLGEALPKLADGAGVDVQTFHGRDHVQLEWTDRDSALRFRADLQRTGQLPRDFVERAPSLEECYLALVRDDTGQAA